MTQDKVTLDSVILFFQSESLLQEFINYIKVSTEYHMYLKIHVPSSAAWGKSEMSENY